MPVGYILWGARLIDNPGAAVFPAACDSPSTVAGSSCVNAEFTCILSQRIKQDGEKLKYKQFADEEMGGFSR